MSDSAPPEPRSTDPELLRLRQEVVRLEQELQRSRQPKGPAKSGRGRSLWSGVLITVACLLAPLSVVAVWARGEVTDTDRYVATVAPLASDPGVQQAVATRITAQIFTYLDIEGFTTDAIDAISANRDLTDRQTVALRALAGPVDSGIRSFTQDKVTAVVESDAFEAAWIQANTIAHDQLVQVLSGQQQGVVEVANNEVTLNVGDLVAKVKAELTANGFTIAERIPAVSTQIVLFRSEAISQAQNAYALLDSLGFWLPLVAAALALIGVFLAHDRRKAFVGLGIGLTIGMILAAVALMFARTTYLNELPAAVNADVATTFFDTISFFLRQALWAGAVAGAVLIIGGLLAGPSALGSGVRGLGTRSAAAVQRELAQWGAPMDSARNWVTERASGLRLAAGVAAIAVIMLQRYKTVSLVLWTTVGLLVVLFVIQVFASGREPGRQAVTPDPAG